MQAGRFVSASEIEEQAKDGLFPCYGGNGLRGYTRSFNQNGKYSLIGRQGALCGNVTLADGKFHATEHAVVVTPLDSIDTVWMFYLLIHLNLNRFSTGMAQPGLSVQNLEQVEAVIPKSTQEQEKISSFLSLIDNRIQTQNKIIEDFRSLKQTITKKLFSRQLKFKDLKGKHFPDWRETKFGELTEVVSTRNKNNEKLPVYSINNKSGFVPQNEQFDGIDSDERGYDIKMYKVIGKNTFAYNPARINVGSVGYSGELENIIISSLYVCFKTKESIHDQFLFQYLKTDFFNKEVAKNVEGGVRDYLFYDNFARIKFYMPCIQEQGKIANVLSELDQKIATEASILQNLEDQKKYFLQRLFI